MRIVRIGMAVLTTAALSVVLVGAGFLVCALPPVTPLIARQLADDVTSPFNKEELALVADASRDYAFGTHDIDALQRAIYEANIALARDLEQAGTSRPGDFPQLELVRDPSDPAQVATALASASERFTFSADTISHLDDCNTIARVAYPLLAVLSLVAVGGLVFCHRTGGRSSAGRVLRAAGIIVVATFTVFGIFAAIDFERFFTLFHGVCCSQGNWQFPYDSLLICSLPEPLWAALGGIWLAVTIVCCVLCIVVGTRMTRASRS